MGSLFGGGEPKGPSLEQQTQQQLAAIAAANAQNQAQAQARYNALLAQSQANQAAAQKAFVPSSSVQVATPLNQAPTIGAYAGGGGGGSPGYGSFTGNSASRQGFLGD